MRRYFAVAVVSICCWAGLAPAATESQITFDDWHHTQPCWRPSSTEITYRRWFGWEGWDEMRWQICRSNRGSPVIELPIVDPTYDIERFSWSADGLWMLFDRWDDTVMAHQVFKRQRYQGVDVRLSGGEGRAVDAQWSPDGSAIVYRRVSPAGRNQLWRVQADGTGREQLTPRHLRVLLGGPGVGMTTPLDWVTDDGCEGMAAGDFDEDGETDVAVACRLESTVVVHLGDGSGVLERGADYELAIPARDVAVGLINADAHLDLAVAGDDQGHYMYVLLGNGDGTFGAPQGAYTGAYPYELALGDFNNDGKADIVNVCVWWKRVAVQLGNGDGTFDASIYTITGEEFPRALEALHLNADANLDLVVLNDTAGTVNVLLGVGDGTFTVSGSYPTGGSPRGMAVGDVTGDGNPDVVVSDHADDTISVLPGDGAGALGPRASYATGSGPRGVALTDLDGDTVLDVAVACPGSGDVYFYLGGTTLTPAGGTSAGDGPLFLLAADLNHDSDEELLITNGDARLFHYYQPSFSPDGTQIVFRRGATNVTYEVYRMPSVGGVEIRMTENAGNCRNPVWSPDGTQIAYDVTDAEDFNQIAVVDIGTGVETVLTSGQHPHLRPCFSPDSTRICYERRDDTGYFQVYEVPAAAGAEVALTSSGYDHRFARWAADGTISYQRMDDDDYWQIFELAPDE